MKRARLLRQELDGWAAAWQQVEAFLDRVDGARDTDDPHRRKVEALLAVAAVVQRRQALDNAAGGLAEPVVSTLPARYWDPVADAVLDTAGLSGGGWSPLLRAGRVPGVDELELAVGQLMIAGSGSDVIVLDAVHLPAQRTIFSRVTDSGPAAIRLPGYPGDTALVGGGQQVDVKASAGGSALDGDLVSMFCQERRYVATMSGLPGLPSLPGVPAVDPDDVSDDLPLLRWSTLCARRRLAVSAGGNPLRGMASDAPAGRGVLADADAALALVRSGQPATAALGRVVTGAAAAAQRAPAEATVLGTAADTMDGEGARNPALGNVLRMAAASLRAEVAGWTRLRTAVLALRALPSSPARRTEVDLALAGLRTLVSSALFAHPVDAGPLAADLDDAVGARIGYPDGTQRILRTLETAFTAGWPARLRWFRRRYRCMLEPQVHRFRATFVLGLRALVNGGDTGFACAGLTIGEDTTVGSDTIGTAQPASLTGALDGLDPGSIALAPGPRPSALVVLGVDRVAGRLALRTMPLRVSIEPGGAGTPGVLVRDTALGSVAPGLTDLELRTGAAAAGPAADAPVQQTVVLWSRLCLVFGRTEIDTAVRGAANARTVPEPAPLASLTLHGTVPAQPNSLVFAGLDARFWLGAARRPLVARPGELLLVRGTATPEPGRSVTAHGVFEVEQVLRTTGSALARMDLSAAALLSPDEAAAAEATGEPCAICGVDEDVAVVQLRRAWLPGPLSGPFVLGRDFGGFDAPSLATKRLLPVDLLTQVTDLPATAFESDVDRSAEFAAALENFESWTRFAHGQVRP